MHKHIYNTIHRCSTWISFLKIMFMYMYIKAHYQSQQDLGLAMIRGRWKLWFHIIPVKFSVKMFLGHYQLLTTISLQLQCTLQENQKIQTNQLVYELPEKKNILVTYISTAGKLRVMLPNTWSPYFKYPRNPMAM